MCVCVYLTHAHTSISRIKMNSYKSKELTGNPACNLLFVFLYIQSVLLLIESWVLLVWVQIATATVYTVKLTVKLMLRWAAVVWVVFRFRMTTCVCSIGGGAIDSVLLPVVSQGAHLVI